MQRLKDVYVFGKLLINVERSCPEIQTYVTIQIWQFSRIRIMLLSITLNGENHFQFFCLYSVCIILVVISVFNQRHVFACFFMITGFSKQSWNTPIYNWNQNHIPQIKKNNRCTVFLRILHFKKSQPCVLTSQQLPNEISAMCHDKELNSCNFYIGVLQPDVGIILIGRYMLKW